jgi:hypothetical protein
MRGMKIRTRVSEAEDCLGEFCQGRRECAGKGGRGVKREEMDVKRVVFSL